MPKKVRCFRIIFLSLLFLLIVMGETNAQQKADVNPVAYQAFISGTSMLITIPAGFVALADSSGYLHPGSSSSIMIKDMPGSSYEKVVEALQNGQLQKYGNAVVGSEHVTTTEGKNGIIFTLTFTAKSKDGKQDVPFERMLFLTGDMNHTLWITANYPAVIKKYIAEELRECMLSVKTKTE
ncbi:MAG: hypothetical protein WCM76_08800 [Bacteroidota bacterium]